MVIETLARCLDEHQRYILSANTFDGVNALCHAMSEIRMQTDDEAWRSDCKPFIAAHPVYRLLQQDPYTRRANEKPRGYAGDAVMLDYLYFQDPPEGTSDFGREVFRCTVASPGGEAVRWRARHFADRIDRLSGASGDVHCLSLACGHLREAEYSDAIRARRVRVTAADQDAESLSTVRSAYGAYSIEAVHCSVRDVIKGDLSFDGVQLAYAAGLYDYLPRKEATALTARLFSMLSPGGSVVVPNFLARNPVRGYMESFMDWYLVVRTPDEIQALGSGIPGAHIASTRYYEDPFGVVGYLEIVKTSGAGEIDGSSSV